LIIILGLKLLIIKIVVKINGRKQYGFLRVVQPFREESNSFVQVLCRKWLFPSRQYEEYFCLLENVKRDVYRKVPLSSI
jgi:hypothetical protein